MTPAGGPAARLAALEDRVTSSAAAELREAVEHARTIRQAIEEMDAADFPPEDPDAPPEGE